MHRALPPAGIALAALFLAALGVTDAQQPNNRFDQFTRQFASTPDQATILAASYIGGAGTEWLVGGGIQPDGTIVLAGVALGPTLDIAGAQGKVIGTDTPAPPAPDKKQQKDKKGNPVTDKQGNPKYEGLTWKHDQATAFVVRLSSDLKQVKSVTRLPWKAGGLTSAAVDGEGNIYLAGPASDGIKAAGPAEELPVGDTGAKSGSCKHTYLARLSPDAAKVVWLKHFRGFSAAPEVDVGKDGKIRFTGPDLRVFDKSGTLESTVIVPGGITARTAIHPRNGTFARGGEHHWHTGREPYRDPILNIYTPQGKLLYELYNWDGPLVGLDNLRLVSDSAVKIVRYDDEGNLILAAWSDGGNSVMYREPNDLRTPSKKMGGLGFSAYGAGVLSCSYLIRIETDNYKVIGGTPWLAFLRNNNKPNSINIDTLGFASDGSICFGGSSAWGLIQTGNAIGGGEPAGPYVAVLNKDCNSLRFCSAMPSCGKVEINDGGRWGVVRGVLKGRPVALFLGGAVDEEDVYGKRLPAPTVNPGQPRFGGGLTDGHALLLDLGPKQ